jgi:hypothetical protein
MDWRETWRDSLAWARKGKQPGTGSLECIAAACLEPKNKGIENTNVFEIQEVL